MVLIPCSFIFLTTFKNDVCLSEVDIDVESLLLELWTRFLPLHKTSSTLKPVNMVHFKNIIGLHSAKKKTFFGNPDLITCRQISWKFV